MDYGRRSDSSEDRVRDAERVREIQNHNLKRRIRRHYAKKYREEYRRIRKEKGWVRAKISAKVKEIVAVKKTTVLVTAGTIAFILILLAALGSCSVMTTEGISAVASASFQSRPAEIDAADLQMTKLEMELQDQIDGIEEAYPGYDEYEYNLDQIGHDPLALISYLSAKEGDFTASRVEGDINDLYDRMYDLSTEEREETRTRTVTKTGTRPVYDEETGEEVGEEEYEYEEDEEYTVRILSVTLKAKDLDSLTVKELTEEERNLRDTLMETKGLLQYYYSPLELNWQSYIKSYYGYRKNPRTGEMEFNKGVDIAVPEGTPVYAAQDGNVSQAAFDEDYGNFVVIENDKSYVSKYAHLSSITVSKGQEVNHGEVIGYTGHSGSATGSELHIECQYRGESYNPLFYFEDGEGSLYDTDPDTGEMIPVEATGDAKALIDEAMKYLDYPYRWGGSSPETSFDCSGYVSWCLNASGYAEVGRQTAQGLYNLSRRVDSENVRPGDLIFFTGTYNSGHPVSHVGIYI